ncbi:uncharacterized protein [Montipora foliosa]|uniref:uncharacterized protein isoform X2 n=1 Tax=Montipora foliosa TaxID=591990 RepID=UPI0035F14FBD
MMDRAVREIIFLLTFLLFSAVGLTQVHAKEPRERHLFVQRQSPLPGSPRKLLTVEREAHDNFPCSDQQDAYKILSRVRRSLNPDTSPKVNEFKLNDSHYLAYVHWAGDHRDTIVVLTRDRTLTKNSSSHVWVSNNYGVSFRNLTKLFTLPDTNNGTFARIDMFYSSPVDNTRYLLVDTLHKAMYSTIDDFNSIVIGKNVSFSPDEICFHPSNSDVVLGYDESSSKLYYSTDFGSTWQLKDENVRSYFWGIPPWDSANTLYIEREEITGGLSNIIKTDYFSNFGAKVLDEGVHEFNMIDNYMFAVVPQSGSVSLTLKVSVNRSSFQTAQIPTASPTRDFFVADASENQVFLAVASSARTAHLYISDTTGIKYSLSMERVLYFSQSTSVPWRREYRHDRFVDLHKVKGLRGVYIASHLTPGRVGTRRIVTKITFDKGGFWQPVAAPKVDSNGRALNCSLPTCSLQLSQKFGSYFRDTHFTPMKSWREAPGIIMATGTYGENLHRGADIFLSADAGLSWHMILQSPWWWYNLGDHGGIFIAVRRARLTNMIYYSWNEGETWLTYKFLDKSTMYVHGLLTEPGEQSAQFTIFGSFALSHKWIVVQIDLTKVLGTPGPHNVDLEHKSPQLGKAYPSCSSDHFTCANRHCIPARWVCDYDNDCGDNSDEQGCTPAPTTPAQTTFSATQFSCRNGHLIPKRWFCDGVNDCGDRSDEPSQCSRLCTSYQFTCGTGWCIPRRWRCDGESDCIDSSDEAGCPSTTSTSKTTTQSFSPKPCYFWKFTCSNGRCVDNGYRCDGQDNCGDGSDEVGCVAPTNTTIQTTTAPHCPPGWLLCAYGRSQICIKYTWLCDGIPNCPDRWDEKPENCLTSSLKVERVYVFPNSGGTSVNVHWHPITIRPPGVVFPGYRVSYRSVSLHTLPSIGDWQSKDTESTNYFIVSGLQPCSEYEFKVQVLVKGSAPGPYSDVVNAKTMTAQTSPPQNVQHVLKGVDAIQITWEPPATYCHVITNYKVLYKESTSITFLSVETGNILSYLLTGLTGGKTYDIKIEAYSSDGDSAPSQVQHVSISLNPPTVPVTNLRTINVTDTTVTLAWGAPRTSSGHIIPVLGYKIYKNSMEQINASDKHNYTVKSLKSKTKYTFTVKPYNRDGNGPPVNIEATTIGISAPRNVTAVPFNLTAVVLSWKPPQFGSTSHVKYYIFYGTVNSGVSAQPMGSATEERFVVGNLQADVVYVFEVSLGLTGPHSDPAHSLTKIDFPHPPVHSLQLRIVDVTTVYLSWNGTKGNDTSIRNYKITTSYNVGSESHTRTVYLVKTSYTFRYLKFNTDYTFAVQAKFNDNKLSDSVSARTKTGPFSAPVDPLIAREHTDDTVTLSWSAPRTVNLSRIHYKLYWNCPRCYSSYYWSYRRSGSAILAGTTTNYTLRRLYRGRTYFFSVHAETILSNVGKNATASLVIGYYVGRVQKLSASVDNYTMTVQWTPPNDLDPKEIKSYAFSYCNYSRASYCYPNNHGNVSKKVHQFEVPVLAGYTYSVNVYAVTPFGRGTYANVKHTLPPLSVKVSSVYSYVSGNYGLQLYIHWHWYYSYTYPNVEYEVSWHCVRSSGSYCYWSPSYGLTTRVVNSTSLDVNVTHYDRAYEFDVVAITSRGRGEAYPLVVYIPPLNGIPGNFTCSVLKGVYYNSYLQCEWSKPTDVNPVGFYNYQLRYRCEDCIYKEFNYKYVYSFDATRANLSVSTGSRYQVYIQVSTRYGMGRSTAATVHVPSTVGPVLQLNAMVDEHNGSLVNLMWSPPRGGHPQFYFVSYRCISCGDTTTLKVFDTHKQLTLFCGSYYNFSVRAVVNGVSGHSSETVVRLASNVDEVTNLAVHLFSVKVNNSQNVFGVDEGFLLTWEKPQNAEDIETYEIVVRRVDSYHIIMANRTAGSETRWRLSSYENPEIDVGQNYSFEVRSKARLCYGKKSVVFAVLPVGEVRNLVAVSDKEIATTAHLSWSSPAPRTPAQQYYIVHITCSSCGITFLTETVSTFFKQKGLSCGNTYKVMVRAVINGIFGKETKTSLTVDPKIGAVTNLAVQRELSKEGFHLTWTKPNNVTNIEIETYEIIVRRFDRDQPIITSNTSGNETHWTLSWSENPKIDVGQNYSFEVRAKARSCYGVKNVVFALLLVGQVLNLVAKPDKEIATTAHLSWNSPASRTSVQYYTVHITCFSCGINIFTVAFSTFFNQKGLPCGNTYDITVRAVIRGIFGEETKTWFKVDPKIGAVTNLAVQFIPANGSTVEELSKEGFHLTWAEPNNLTDNEIESYEIKVRGPDKGQLVITAHTKETQWTIRAKDNLFIAKAQNFSFEVRCKAKSCYGPVTTVSALAEAPPSLLPSPVPIKQGSRKGMSPVVWAVPVGIVSLILIAVIIFCAMKYRRLERSMYALLIRRTASVSEDDELPLLQTFSDDEPLINA